jgi:hypothetical protein
MAFASASAPRRRRVFDHGEESEKTKSAFVTKPREEDDDEEDEEYEEEMMRASDEKEDDGEEDHASCSMTSTVLLEKNRELDAIAMKLQRTIYECEKTTKRLDEREGILLQAQESLHRDCAKFENFARENERKMQKAMESAKESKMERLVLENEVLVALRKEASSFGRRRRRCERKNRALSSVLKFLRACCGQGGRGVEDISWDGRLSIGSSSGDFEVTNAPPNENEDEEEQEVRGGGEMKFEDISDILYRHATLKDVNNSLRARKEFALKASKEAFEDFSQRKKDIEETIESEKTAAFTLSEKQKETTTESKRERDTAKARMATRTMTEKSLALIYAAVDNLSCRCNLSCPEAQKQKHRNLLVADEDEENNNTTVATTKFTQAHVDLEFVHSRAKVLNQIIHSSANVCITSV